MTSIIALVLGSVAATYLFFLVLLHVTQDAKEPPTIETSISFISPLLGLVHGMQKYTVSLRDQYGHPIYTLRMPGQRIYVINSISLIPPLQRELKTIAFAPIEAQAAATVMGVGPAGNAIIGSKKMFEHDSYLSTFVPSTFPALSPGPGLDAINGAAIQNLSHSLADISENGPTTVELFPWVCHQLFMATTESIYGPKNPFRDPTLEKAWHDFEPSIMIHMLKALPSFLAPKSLYARDQLLIPAFEKYFAENSHHKGSLLVQCRYKHNTGHGLKGRDVAATEIGQMVATLTNSVAAAFWMVYHDFSDTTVLKECREEETLRYVHIGISARVVINDIMFENRYLLKKGATVMTIAPVQHSEVSVWGPTVNVFDHRRFLRKPGEKRTNPVAFRSFGGGAVLCPGRHFVSTEVMAFTALLLLRFDLKPATKDSAWVEPRKVLPMTSSMPTPKDKSQVKIVPRDNRKWQVNFSASAKGVDMVAEDLAQSHL
ncbi:hypothetical protein DSL72_003193 [Monilinia vaccinii-corymbosi]|uniref:Cytochrome P450 n=1 Tax=Monilinia vaccinii-corymbosi TaxID=61207 RepID=A0A8A3NTB2_9HELO|nr:hypothetical protein DSL72_003193 [Monilinia vaccinii-corymbosi]